MSIMTMSLPAKQLATKKWDKTSTHSPKQMQVWLVSFTQARAHTRTHWGAKMGEQFSSSQLALCYYSCQKRQEGHSGLCYYGWIKLFLFRKKKKKWNGGFSFPQSGSIATFLAGHHRVALAFTASTASLLSLLVRRYLSWFLSINSLTENQP